VRCACVCGCCVLTPPDGALPTLPSCVPTQPWLLLRGSCAPALPLPHALCSKGIAPDVIPRDLLKAVPEALASRLAVDAVKVRGKGVGVCLGVGGVYVRTAVLASVGPSASVRGFRGCYCGARPWAPVCSRRTACAAPRRMVAVVRTAPPPGQVVCAPPACVSACLRGSHPPDRPAVGVPQAVQRCRVLVHRPSGRHHLADLPGATGAAVGVHAPVAGVVFVR
jgi:hypothetical protein